MPLLKKSTQRIEIMTFIIQNRSIRKILRHQVVMQQKNLTFSCKNYSFMNLKKNRKYFENIVMEKAELTSQ